MLGFLSISLPQVTVPTTEVGTPRLLLSKFQYTDLPHIRKLRGRVEDERRRNEPIEDLEARQLLQPVSCFSLTARP